MSKHFLTNEVNTSVSTPGSGVSALFFDTDKKQKYKNDSGTVNELLDTSFQSIATAGATTTLTNTSQNNTIFTGVSTQTLVFPDATTLVNGKQYQIDNNSTGLVTVNANGGGGLLILASLTSAYFTLLTNASAPGTWEVDYHGINITTGKVLSVTNSLTLTGTDGNTITFPSGSDTAVMLTGTQNITGVKTMTNMTTAAGTTAIPSMTQTAGTNLTSAVAGAWENDAIGLYFTTNTTDGRANVPIRQHFRLTANGSNVTTIANFFGATSNISLVASAYYDIEIMCFFTKTTSEILTWTFTNSAAPTSQQIYWEQSPITGVVAPPGTATSLIGQFINDATAARTVAAGSLTTAVNHYMRCRILLKNGTGTSLKIQCANPAGSITPLLGSFWTATRIPTGNTGTFAA